MNEHFIDANGNYFVAIQPIDTPFGTIAVPARPAPHWGWDAVSEAWVEGQPPSAPVPQSITFAQLLIGLVTEAWITEAEGEAWLAGTLPAPVLSLIATLPAGQQFAAKARALRPSVVMRVDPLVASLGAAQGKTDAELDAFFTTYAQV